MSKRLIRLYVRRTESVQVLCPLDCVCDCMYVRLHVPENMSKSVKLYVRETIFLKYVCTYVRDFLCQCPSGPTFVRLYV